MHLAKTDRRCVTRSIVSSNGEPGGRRVLTLPPPGERFIINDRGLCEFADRDPCTGKDWPSHGVSFPLGPTLGLLRVFYTNRKHRRVFRPLEFSERLTLNYGYTTLLNLPDVGGGSSMLGETAEVRRRMDRMGMNVA